MGVHLLDGASPSAESRRNPSGGGPNASRKHVQGPYGTAAGHTPPGSLHRMPTNGGIGPARSAAGPRLGRRRPPAHHRAWPYPSSKSTRRSSIGFPMQLVQHPDRASTPEMAAGGLVRSASRAWLRQSATTSAWNRSAGYVHGVYRAAAPAPRPDSDAAAGRPARPVAGPTLGRYPRRASAAHDVLGTHRYGGSTAVRWRPGSPRRWPAWTRSSEAPRTPRQAVRCMRVARVPARPRCMGGMSRMVGIR